MPAEHSTTSRSKKTATTPSCTKYDTRSAAELELLRQRLRDEGALDLLAKIQICQQPLVLKCLTCGARKEVRQRCKRKWCPCCAKQLASARSLELDFIVARMRYPLFVTLTMKNVSNLSSGGVRKLRRAFGKLRHRKLWKSSTRGGIAAVEVTNIGNGWHPHLHAVIDCQWLAWKTPAPMRRDSPDTLKSKFKSAAIELESAWSKCLGQETSSVKVKRADRNTIAKEVVKYTVKNEDLILCEGKISELIHALDSTRLMTTFGRAHGQCVKEIRLAARDHAKKVRAEFASANNTEPCCPVAELMPDIGLTQVAQVQCREFERAKKNLLLL